MLASGPQPLNVRLFVFANVLLWGVQIPMLESAPGPHVLLSLLAGFLAPASLRVLSARACLAAAAVFGYGMLAFALGPCTDGGIKAFSSVLVMALVLVSIGWTARSVRRDLPLLPLSDAKLMLGLIVAAAVIEYLYKFALGISPTGGLRVGGLYLEPSHLALATLPLMVYLWFCGRPLDRLLAIAAGSVIAVVGFSSTLLLLLLPLVCLPYLGQTIRKPTSPGALLSLLLIALVPALLITFALSEDTLLRINDVVDLREDSNLSSLVYANGWQLLFTYVGNTQGLGVGFNAMGCSPRAITEITDWLELINLGDQNFNDGSFLMSKITSEFGLPGAAFFIALTIYAVWQLLRVQSLRPRPVLVLAILWLTTVTVGGFIRSGGGYFAGPVLLGLFGLSLLLAARRRPAAPLAAPAVTRPVQP